MVDYQKQEREETRPVDNDMIQRIYQIQIKPLDPVSSEDIKRLLNPDEMNMITLRTLKEMKMDD